MPQLHHDAPAFGMHGIGHLLPAVQLLGAVQAGHVGIALALGLMAVASVISRPALARWR
jgi:hypothetical protein